jgi:hypothetical protein
MAFTGTAVFTMVADDLVRITGLSLDVAATGTLALFGYEGSPGPEILPQAFQPKPYTLVYGDVTLEDSIQVSVTLLSDGDPGVDIGITKENGDDPTLFLITIGNLDSEGVPSGELDIYVRFH